MKSKLRRNLNGFTLLINFTLFASIFGISKIILRNSWIFHTSSVLSNLSNLSNEVELFEYIQSVVTFKVQLSNFKVIFKFKIVSCRTINISLMINLTIVEQTFYCHWVIIILFLCFIQSSDILKHSKFNVLIFSDFERFPISFIILYSSLFLENIFLFLVFSW